MFHRQVCRMAWGWLLLVALGLVGSAEIKCPEVFPWEELQCFCDSMTLPSQKPGWEVACLLPLDYQGAFIIRASYRSYVLFECQDSTPFLPGMLETFNLTDITTFYFDFCPAPSMSLAEILRGHTVKSLSFERQREENSTLPVLDNLDELFHLDLKKNNIKFIPPHYFDNLTTLNELALHENEIASISSEIFAALDKLAWLQLGANKIVNISETAFNNNTKLKRLYMYQNRFQSLPENLFYELPLLELLDLSYNELETLPSNIFSKNHKLINLSLRGNQLKEIANEIFYQNLKLGSLDLSYNAFLKVLPETLFDKLNFLENVSLSHCDLVELPDNLFKPCLALQDLNLRNNRLTQLSPKLLSNNNKLLKFDASFNDIASLHADLFSHKYSLKELILSRNNLTDLPNSLFSHQINLEKLLLGSNLLTVVPKYVLENLRRLQVLDLSRNQITDFQSKYITYSTEIRVINLSRNQLKSLSKFDWILYTNLEKVDFEYNNISLFVVPVLYSSNTQLKFGHNNISQVSVSELKINDAMTKFLATKDQATSLKYPPEFYFDPNPLICDCLLYDFADYYSKNKAKTIKSAMFADYDKLFCSGPPKVQGTLLLKMDPSEFICDRPINCPYLCSCYMRAFDKSIVTNCRHLNLTEGPHITPFNTSILLLESNRLTNLEFLNLPIWKNLTELYLDNNTLTSLEDWVSIPTMLRILSIKNNLISQMPALFLEYLDMQKNLQLSFGSSSWNCSCALQPFKSWITMNHKNIDDIEHILCSAPIMQNETEVEVSVAQIPDDILCPVDDASHATLIIIISVTFSFIALTLFLISVLYYRNKPVVIAYIYLHFYNVFLCLFNDEDIDDDKIFDGFVSYSTSDNDVAFELVSELENTEPYFKLCVHERDWLPGNMISWNIANSVQNSRKTILVLSKAFLESMWFQVEFHTAYYQMLEDRIDRLIVIIKGDLPPKESLDKDLQLLLSTKTYLVWGEKWFWEKLRYAMPHKKILAKKTTKRFRAKPKPSLLSTVEAHMASFMILPTRDAHKSPPRRPDRKAKSKTISSPAYPMTKLPSQTNGAIPIEETKPSYDNHNFVNDEDIVLETTEVVLNNKNVPDNSIITASSPSVIPLTLDPLLLNAHNGLVPLEGNTQVITVPNSDGNDSEDRIYMLQANV